MATFFSNATLDVRGGTIVNVSGNQTNYFGPGSSPLSGWPLPPQPGRPNVSPSHTRSHPGPPSHSRFSQDRPLSAPSSTLASQHQAGMNDPSTLHAKNNSLRTASARNSYISPSPHPSPSQRGSRVVIPRTRCIYGGKLPTLEKSLADALADFRTNVSPWKNPQEWIYYSNQHFSHILEDVRIVTEDPNVTKILSTEGMVYPRLFIYVYTHLKYCTNDQSLTSRLERMVSTWRNLDSVTLIQIHQSIKEDLQDFVQRGIPLHPNNDVIPKLLTLDTIHLCAQLAAVVSSKEKYTILVAKCGDAAQSLINLLQARLDLPIDASFEARHAKALIQLTRQAGLYPECLILSGVDMKDEAVDEGGFGSVHKGMLGRQVIAVKIFKTYTVSDKAQALKALSLEAVIWRRLRHPNILPFYGIYQAPLARFGLVSPLMVNGNVVDYLDKKPSTNCVLLALDTAEGLKYLHSLSPPIIHNDLKGYNILITYSERACLADFGLSRAVNSGSISVPGSSSERTGGTLLWQAPEVIEAKGYDGMASDIYALACVYYEMFFGKMPFHEISRESDGYIFKEKSAGRIPTRPDKLCSTSKTRGLTDEFWKLMEWCWSRPPSQRPTADAVVRQIHALPGRAVDERSFDDDDSFSTIALKTQKDHPLHALLSVAEDSDEMQELKWVSRECGSS